MHRVTTSLSVRAFWVGAILLTSLPTATAQRTLLKETRQHDVTVQVVADVNNSTLVRLARNGVASTARLPEPYTTIEQLVVTADAKNVVVSGSSLGESRVVVLDTEVATVKYASWLVAPVISRDARFIVGERHRSRPEATASANYTIVALDVPTDGRSALSQALFYGHDGRIHHRQSDFFWVLPNVVAFLDLVDGKTSVVAAEFNREGSVRRLVAKELETDRFVDASQVDGSGQPASAIYGPTITPLSGDGLRLRLLFPGTPALRIRRADVQLWD